MSTTEPDLDHQVKCSECNWTSHKDDFTVDGHGKYVCHDCAEATHSRATPRDVKVCAQPMAQYRNEDPETSRAAAIDMEKSGQAKTDRLRCLQAVRDWPGLTAGEYAERLKVERAVVSRRLPELRELGLVENGEARPCNTNAKKAMTWKEKK
jgi:DNA-binding transcriptional ArsR family regulator